MTKLQEPHTSSVSRANEARLHGRRKLATMAYVELGQDNGGILLNIGEGGLAVQSALTLTSKDFPEIRFQLPRFRRWFTVSGRLAWISESRTEAGIQFVDMPEAVRTQITNWISSETAELQEGTNGDAHG